MPIAEYGKYRIPLSDGIKRIFIDGFNAVMNEGDARVKLMIQACQACSERVLDDFYCLDVDAFKTSIDYKLYGALRPSVDIAVPLYSHDTAVSLLLIEAKIGEKSIVDDSRPRHPGREELIDKYNFSKERLSPLVDVESVLYFVVPRNTYNGQRYRASRWNKGTHSCEIVVRCCDQFMNDLGLFDGSQYWLCEHRQTSLGSLL